MKKILTIIGARPQFIKAAAVSRKVSDFQMEEVIVHTGQHFDKNMSEIFFEEMEIPQPHYNLNINSMSHGAMTGRMMEEIEKVIKAEKPDILMVYGDTNSTIAGALAAKKALIKVAHVEAGLRSFNMAMPEEINRILTDRISDYLFCPTQTAIRNLKREGFDNFDCRIFHSGDVMYDAALYYSEKSGNKSTWAQKQNLNAGSFVLCTVHRQENTDDPIRLKSIVNALNKINKEKRVILPLHPRTRKILNETGLTLDFDPIEPVGYFDILELLKNASLVMTDSGGMQKEAYFFKKYCITLRDETEWVELVENKVNTLVGADTDKIISNFKNFTDKPFPLVESLYGDGHSAEKILSILEKD
jgi:UDP-GlcNAc3NAcA epimerase